jgi:hypothetical protein
MYEVFSAHLFTIVTAGGDVKGKTTKLKQAVVCTITLSFDGSAAASDWFVRRIYRLAFDWRFMSRIRDDTDWHTDNWAVIVHCQQEPAFSGVSMIGAHGTEFASQSYELYNEWL